MIPNQDLSKYGGLEFLIESDYDPKLLNLEDLPEFYHTILSHWHNFRRLANLWQANFHKYIYIYIYIY